MCVCIFLLYTTCKLTSHSATFRVHELVQMLDNRLVNNMCQQPPACLFLPKQNLAKPHHLSSNDKSSKSLRYINTDMREQSRYTY